MAVNGNRRRRRRKKSETAELSARLAPLEEQQKAQQETSQLSSDGQPSGGDDTIRVNTATLMVPTKLVEEEREGTDIFYLDPVVRYILILFLVFIAFIAWQVAQMSPPAK